MLVYFILEKSDVMIIKMSEHTVPYKQCDYFSLKSLCVKKCLGGRCHTSTYYIIKAMSKQLWMWMTPKF